MTETSVAQTIAAEIKAILAQYKLPDRNARAGAKIKELRACMPQNALWTRFVRQYTGMTHNRANRLVRIAEGRTNEEDKRVFDRAYTLARKKRIKETTQCGEACDFDWSKATPEDFGSASEAYRRQAAHYCAEATHLAKSFPLLVASVGAEYVTKSQLDAVQTVVDAWRIVLEKLHHKKQGAKL